MGIAVNQAHRVAAGRFESGKVKITLAARQRPKPRAGCGPDRFSRPNDALDDITIQFPAQAMPFLMPRNPQRRCGFPFRVKAAVRMAYGGLDGCAQGKPAASPIREFVDIAPTSAECIVKPN